MSLKLKNPEIDLGQIQIENLFISDFMPMASGSELKVYLMAYYLASSGNGDISNIKLAEKLKLPLVDVLSAWQFWQGKGLVTLSESDSEEFDVEFLSIRELYLKHNYIKKSIVKKSAKTSVLIANSLEDDMLQELIKSIEETCTKRPLNPEEIRIIARYIKDYKMDYDLVYRAFYLTYIDKEVKGSPFKYIRKVINNWYDNKIYSLADLDEVQDEYSEINNKIKRIIQTIGMSYSNAPQQVKDTISFWLEQNNYSEEYLIYVINQTAKRTNNLNINFLQYQLNEIKKQGAVSIEAAKLYFEKGSKERKKPNKNQAKTKFDNFSQRTYANMSPSEIESIIKKKNANRL